MARRSSKQIRRLQADRVGVTLVEAASGTPAPGLCSRCRNYRNSRASTAQCPNLFCSKQCEQEFVRTAMTSVSLEDCICIQERLETLLIGARQSMARTATRVEAEV